MSRTGIVDIHAHYFPEVYTRLIIRDGERHGARYASEEPGPLIHVEVVTRVPELSDAQRDMIPKGTAARWLHLDT